MKFIMCPSCNQVFINLISSEQNAHCCNQEMIELKPIENDKDHIPHIRKIGNFVTITIGKNHPMVSTHHIVFIFIKTNQGFQFKDIRNEKEAKAEFILAKNEEIENVYIYCNIHLLTSLK
ncbi:MAG: desulfoferrodoxin family protein [Candidatus Izemoplasmataceae bacterium]